MPAYDSQLNLHDGTTITGTITPTSKTRSSGSAVIEMPGGTPADGMVAVLNIPSDIDGATDTLDVDIQDSDTEGSGYATIASFAQHTNGDATPNVQFRRFLTTKSFVRALITATDVGGSGFTLADCYVDIHPAGFDVQK